MKYTKPFFIVSFILLIVGTLIACTGCENSGLRFAPSQPQKQMAELSHDLAAEIEESGTDPHSPAAKALEESTAVTLAHIGMPKAPPFDDYPTTLSQAQADAVKRPTADDVFEMVDKGLGLAELALIILGGSSGIGLGAVGLTKAAGYVKDLRTRTTEAKQQATEIMTSFKEVVKAEEKFRSQLKADPQKTMTAEEALKVLKTYNNEVQSLDTRQEIRKVTLN